jgi:hypothetical protein
MFDPLPKFDFSSLAQSTDFIRFATKKTKTHFPCRLQVWYQSIGHTGAVVMMQTRDPEIRLIIGYRNMNFIVFPQVNCDYFIWVYLALCLF